MATSLKFLGMGGLMKQGERSMQPNEDVQTVEASEDASKGVSKPGMPSWMSGFSSERQRKKSVAEPSERQRKKSIVEEREAEDDRHIRFKIAGSEQRLGKEDFIQQMQQLDKTTRKEVVDQSSASHVVKTLAKQDPIIDERKGSTAVAAGKSVAMDGPQEESSADGSARRRSVSVSSRSSSSDESPGPKPGRGRVMVASKDTGETAVERRRRLAVLAAQGDEEEEDTNETPAERRRREAALAGETGDDSDDDNTPRVPPTRRGIRFADVPERGRD
jgi:sodium/hydrogen antiporter